MLPPMSLYMSPSLSKQRTPRNNTKNSKEQRPVKEEELREMEEIVLLFLPLPDVGHLISTIELAKCFLEKQQCFSITVPLMHLNIPSMKSTAATIASYVQSVSASNPRIRFIDLPLIDFPFDNIQNPAHFVSFIDMYKSHVKEAIKRIAAAAASSSSPPTRIAALIIDFFSTAMIDVGKELCIPTYIYFTSGAALLALMLYLPTLQVKVPCEIKDYQGEIEVPGMLPLPPAMMPSPLVDQKYNGAWFIDHGKRFRETDGLIVNTFAELELTTLKSIANGECLPDHHPTPPVYPVGPLLALDNKSQEPQTTSQLMEWLDQQPHSSVVFLCFGSMGSFSIQQVKEMALGLERSGQHFLWSLRCRSSADTNLEDILPDGFLERTKGRGLVLQSWVPQVDILGHVAVGGFVSHCGWNSTLESIWFGVPMLAWPLYAEQKLNAFQLVRDLGLAVELSMDYEKEEWVSAEELEKGVRCLIGESEEGQKVRKKAKEMAEASKKAVGQGGSSFVTLELLAKKFML